MLYRITLTLLWICTTTRVRSYTFAVIPKRLNSPFFDHVREGCHQASKLLTNVTCLYIGPEVRENASTIQLEIVQQLLSSQQIDGLAIAVMNETSTTQLIDTAVVQWGIPVVTFDSDAATSRRLAYVGTDNVKFGRELAHVLLQLSPDGGKYGIIGGGSSPNVAQRVVGVRAGLRRSAWTEVSTSPTNCQGNITLALEQMHLLVETHPDINAIIPVGGWPMYDPDGWEAFVKKYPQVTTVVADSLAVQLQLVNRGSVNGLVGQLPFQMGVQVIQKLYQYKQQGRLLFVGGGTNNDIFPTPVLNVLQIPQDLPPIQEDMNYIGNLRIMGYVLCGMVVLTALGCLIWTVCYRHDPIVRASQPGFLAMICVGTLIMGSAIIPLSLDDETISLRGCCIACMCVPWLLFTGFATTFSALFSKTWRIVKVYQNSQRFRRVKVTAQDVMIPFVVLMTLNVVVLLCWTLMDPLEYERHAHPGTDNWNRLFRSYYGACHSASGLPYVVCLVGINFCVLCIANYQAYRARKIETDFSESRYIAFIMVTMLQAWLVGIPVLALIHDDPRPSFVVYTIIIFAMCMATLLFLFVPKMIRLAERRNNDHTDSQQRIPVITRPREEYMATITRADVSSRASGVAMSAKSSSLRALRAKPKNSTTSKCDEPTNGSGGHELEGLQR